MTSFNHKTLLFVTTSFFLSSSFTYAAEFNGGYDEEDAMRWAMEASIALDEEEKEVQRLIELTKLDVAPQTGKPLATPFPAADAARAQAKPFLPLAYEEKASEQDMLSAADKIRARRAAQKANEGGRGTPAQAAFPDLRLKERAGPYDFPALMPLPIPTQPDMPPHFTAQVMTTPKPLLQKELGPVVQSEDLKVLATYIVARRGAIRTSLNYIFDESFQFVEHPFCAAVCGGIKLDKDPLKLGDVKTQAHQDFIRFCGDKDFNVEAAQSFFTYFWDQILPHKSLTVFMDTYTKLFELASKPQIKEALVMANSPDGEDAFKQLLMTAGIVPLYGQLKTQKEAFIKNELDAMTPEWLITQSPRIDVKVLLTGKKAAAQLITQPIEEKKPEYIVRPLLSPAVSGLLKDLSREFEERKKGTEGDPSETVMIYGNITAKNYYQRLEDNLNDLWISLNGGLVQAIARPRKTIKAIEEIMALHEEVKDQLGHKGKELEIVKGVLRESLKRHTTPLQRLTLYLTGEKTQYDYLLMVASQVFNFYHVVKEANKDTAYALVGIFFNALIEQQNRCQAGMIGRMLTVHKTNLDMLVDYYYHTPTNK